MQSGKVFAQRVEDFTCGTVACIRSTAPWWCGRVAEACALPFAFWRKNVSELPWVTEVICASVSASVLFICKAFCAF